MAMEERVDLFAIIDQYSLSCVKCRAWTVTTYKACSSIHHCLHY